MTTSLATPEDTADRLRKAVYRGFEEPFIPTKGMLFRKHAQRVQYLERAVRKTEQFLHQAIEFNFGQSRQHFVDPRFLRCGADVAMLPYAEAVKEMERREEESVSEVVEKLRNLLETLVAQHLVGKIRWLSPEVCRFYHFVATREPGFVQGREAIIHRHMKFVHDVMDARIHSLPAWMVRKPKRVEQILRVMPSEIEHVARIVTGKEIVREAIEIQRHLEYPQVVRQTYEKDPALVLGEYVIAGWDNEELKNRITQYGGI